MNMGSTGNEFNSGDQETLMAAGRYFSTGAGSPVLSIQLLPCPAAPCSPP